MPDNGGAWDAPSWTVVSLQQLRVEMQQFSSDRDWDQYHTPRNLVLALVGYVDLYFRTCSDTRGVEFVSSSSFLHPQVGEVGELAELFQWRTESEAAPGLPGFSSEDRRCVEDELSDVLLYLTRLADRCGVDLGAAVKRKLEKNAAKYPADKCKGASDKYTKYQTNETQAGSETDAAP